MPGKASPNLRGRVVLIHGYTGNADHNWFANGIAAALAKNHRVVAPGGIHQYPRRTLRLLAEVLRQVADHRQLESLALECLHHAEDPADQREQSEKAAYQADETETKHRTKQAAPDEEPLQRENGTEKDDRLHRVEADRGTLVDQEKYQAGNPAENVTEQPGHVLLDSGAACHGYSA